MDWNTTLQLLPEGVSTLSKRPCVYVEGYPKYLVRGKGCRVWDENDKEYIQYPCGLGPNILGHAYPSVVEAIIKQVKDGISFSLPHPSETELSLLLKDICPSLEKGRYVNSGSEACNAAVRIARAYTGRWPLLVSGYNGWADFYNCTTPKCAGVVKQDVTRVTWGDFARLKELIEEKQPAAYMLEPYVYEDEDTCKKYLQQVKGLCTTNNVILIFDEVVTSFRSRRITAQETVKVRPDLTCLGKAMANGFPIGYVGGKKELLDVLEDDCFVSSTFAGNPVAMAAALATIKVIKEQPVYYHLENMGQKIKVAFNNAATSIMQQDTTECIGQPQRTFFKFPTPVHKGAFWQYCIERGIFFGFAQFVSFSHDQTSVERTTATIREAMYALNKYWQEPEKMLKGPAPQETLRTIVLPAAAQLTIQNGKWKSGTVDQPVPIPKEIIETPKEVTGFVSQPVPTGPPKRKPGRPRKK